MLEIFRKNYFLNSLLLLPYAVLLRIHSLLHPQPVPEELGGFFTYLGFHQLSPAIGSIIAILVVFFVAVLINRLSIINRLSHEQTLFPGVFFILISSAHPSFLKFWPVFIALVFQLFSMLEMFTTYKKTGIAKTIFNTGFYTGIAALFYFPFIAFFLLNTVSLAILRAFQRKEWLQMMVGLLMPFYLILAWFFIRGDNIVETANAWFFSQFRLHWVQPESTRSWILIATFGILILIAISYYNRFNIKKSIQVQKKIDILYWHMLLTVPTVWMTKTLLPAHLLILSIPLAIFLGLLIAQIKERMFAEIIHLVMLVGILLSHFNYL